MIAYRKYFGFRMKDDEREPSDEFLSGVIVGVCLTAVAVFSGCCVVAWL